MDMLKSKTFWTGILTGVATILKAFDVPIPNEAFVAMLALMGIFMRMGVNKSQKGGL